MCTEQTQNIEFAKQKTKELLDLTVPEIKETIRGNKELCAAVGIYIQSAVASMISITTKSGKRIEPFKLMEIMGELSEVTEEKNSQVYNAVIEGISTLVNDTKSKNEDLHYPCFEGMLSSVKYVMEAFGEKDDDPCTWFKVGRSIYNAFEYLIAKTVECKPFERITSTEFKLDDNRMLEYSLILSWAIHSEAYEICLRNEEDYVTLMFLMSEFMSIVSSKDGDSRIEKFMENYGCYPLYAVMAYIKENSEKIRKVKEVIRNNLKEHISNIMFLDTVSSFVYLFNQFHKKEYSREDDIILIFALFDIIAPIADKNSLINKLANSILSSGLNNLDNRNN